MPTILNKEQAEQQLKMHNPHLWAARNAFDANGIVDWHVESVETNPADRHVTITAKSSRPSASGLLNFSQSASNFETALTNLMDVIKTGRGKV